MRFVADGMLGKLTRWLRMLGHDVEYFKLLEDEELIKVAKSEQMILLTRDLRLYQKAATEGVKAHLVEGRTEHERLAELARKYDFGLEIDVSTSRCPKCNSRIKPVRKEEVMERIPESTSRFYNEFWECQNCGKIYWQGSHWKRIDQILSQAKETLRKSKASLSPRF